MGHGGAREKISEEVRETIKSLRGEGMSINKIAKAKDISTSSVFLICKGIEKGKRGGQITEKPDEDPRQIVKEIKESIDGLQAAYVETLRAIRADLIRARARLQERKVE